MRKIQLIVILLFCTCLMFNVSTHAQRRIKETQIVSLSSRLIDQDGNPINNAVIYSDEGSIIVKTDVDGGFTITVSAGSLILIESEGYASFKVHPDKGFLPSEITLTRLHYQMTENDIVFMPFGTLKKRHIVGAVSVLDPDELLKYDAKNDIYSAMRGRITGLLGNQNVYGLGNALMVVDGIPRSVSSLDLHEVKQISVLKDASSRLLYGIQANQPVILITTKRGEAYKKHMGVRLESGIMDPISYPKYLGAADHMAMTNEALINDGKLPKYDSLTIKNTTDKINPILYPDEDYYTSVYIKENKSYYRLMTEASGGNEIAQYYAYIGWETYNSLLVLGRDKGFNRINLRGNVDYKINDYMKMNFDGIAVFEITKGENGNFWENSSTFHPNLYPVLIPATDSSLIAEASLIDGKYVLGGTSEYQKNIYGDLVSAGYLNSLARTVQINSGLDLDMGFITEGLTASVYMTFDMYTFFRTRLLNTYAVYQPQLISGTNGDTLIYIKTGLDTKQGNESLINPDFSRKVGAYGTINYQREFNGVHQVNAVAVAYHDQFQMEAGRHPIKNLHFGLQANYAYKNKYMAQLGGVAAGSPAFSLENRYSYSPAFGLGWIISEEDFIPSGIFDFLKLKANWGLIHDDAGYYNSYLFQTNYGQGSYFYYNHGVVRNYKRYFLTTGNPDLDWEKRKEFTAGFEALVLNKTLFIEGTYFRSKRYDVIIPRVNYYPSLLGSSSELLPYENYNSFLHNGFDIGTNYKRNFGGLTLSTGINFIYTVPKILKIDEPNYEYDYLKKTGKPTDTMFGWVAMGLFQDQSDIDNHAFQTFGTVQPGDIKYKDLNNDGLIDENDQTIIGYSNARMQYSFNINLKYKAFQLFILGTGQSGQDTYYNNAYYWVYGDRKFSEVVLERWTPATAQTATYPRLSSTFNSNNFRNSTYWITELNWFTIHTTQLNLTLPDKLAEKTFVKDLKVYLRGSNLLTISKNREKMELNIGAEPQFRTYAIGINASF